MLPLRPPQSAGAGLPASLPQSPKGQPSPGAGASGVRSAPEHPDRPSLRLDVNTDRWRPLIQATGELDVHSAPLLQAIIDHTQHAHLPPTGGATHHDSCRIELDLSRVTFADSHGLAPALDTTNATVVAAWSVPAFLDSD
jgi:hypothetical protein